MPSSDPQPNVPIPGLPADPSTLLLRVDRDAVPRLRKRFNSAFDKLDVQIDLAISGIRVSPWAGDPVSANAATNFNTYAVDGTFCALNALLAYEKQLKSAYDKLTEISEKYGIVESDNTDMFGAGGGF